MYPIIVYYMMGMKFPIYRRLSKMKKRTNMNKDNKLIRNMRNNKNPSYAELVRKYKKLILFLCNKRCRNQEDAEEMCNDIILKIFCKTDMFDPGKGDLGSWINNIAANYLKDNIKKDDPSDSEVSLERYFDNEFEDEDSIHADGGADGYWKNEIESANVHVCEPSLIYGADAVKNIPGAKGSRKLSACGTR